MRKFLDVLKAKQALTDVKLTNLRLPQINIHEIMHKIYNLIRHVQDKFTTLKLSDITIFATYLPKYTNQVQNFRIQILYIRKLIPFDASLTIFKPIYCLFYSALSQSQ